ncbi:SGNH/GDSL hydrolase family protein [Luteibacter sp. SG786]|uniref:SGNH/GDSL hydrolase family protein n=1 Tax=Luteibacter sp. SG786 TaxID=2587130 RepID=UPI001420480D|nr:thermolabile hemolysin [Luteibacter sp. SG786]
MKILTSLIGMAAIAACLPIHAQSTPPFEVGLAKVAKPAYLRCVYPAPTASSPTATGYIQAKDFLLHGNWAGISLNPGANLFYTDHRPDELRRVCEQTLRDFGIGERPVQWTAASSDRSYHHQIWYDGTLSHNGAVERIVAFGDSLSDTGNFHNLSQWAIPAERSWFLGRFSNGPVWTEYLADMTGIPLNTWAIGTAETQDTTFVDGLESQIDSFERYMSRTTGYDTSRTLFTVLAGANDFMSDKRQDFASVGTATRQLEASLVRLGQLGARKIALLNLPDIARVPRYRGNASKAALVGEKARRYNQALPAIVATIRERTGMDIRLIDIATMFDELLADPAAEGFNNVVDACLDIEDTKLHYATGRPMRRACTPHSYVFWDLVHPTTAVHRLIAQRVNAEVARDWGLDHR